MTPRTQRRRPRYLRTAIVGTASAAFLLAGLSPASGETSRPLQAAPFSNGMAKATARISKFGPGVGNLELALGSGIAVSELKNQLAQAQAQTVDLGLIGTTLTAEGCDGSAPMTADQLPQATRVDNRQGDTAATSDELPLGGSNLGGGREMAEATATPSATAIATTLAAESPVVSLAGGRSSATTRVVDGAAREAHAVTDVDVTLGGVVELSGLRWDALHRTGEDPQVVGTFDIGSARLAGMPLPVDSLADVQTAVNQALAPTGLSIEMPRVERIEEPTDLVRVTPLRITMRDSQVGAATLGPGLNASRQQREQLFDQLSAAYCDLAGALFVGDIGVSVLSGTGFFIAEIGGVEAISGDFLLDNPFGEAVAPLLAPVGPGAPPDLSLPGGGTGLAAPAVAPAPAAAPPSAPTQPVASIGPLEEACESIHPFGSPGCSTGALAPLGLLGLLATGAVGALDWRHQQRRLAATTVGTVA